MKEARFDLLPMDALWFVARVFGKGAAKYAERNWERGLKWGSSKGALDRHLALFWAGEDLDEESGLPHLAHVAWHGLVLLAMYLRGAGDDDRSREEAVFQMVAEVTNPEEIEAARAEAEAGDVTLAWPDYIPGEFVARDPTPAHYGEAEVAKEYDYSVSRDIWVRRRV